MKIPYDHSDRIGNEGDVVKHAVLCRFVDKILREGQEAPFFYVETHTGRPQYILPERGRWLNGIRLLSEKLAALKEIPTNLEPYYELCFQMEIEKGTTYLGSCGIVLKMLNKKGIPPKLLLSDTDIDVCNTLLEYFSDWPEVAVCQRDGYETTEGLKGASLVLIDPVSIKEEMDKIVVSLKNLNSRNIPFLCWTALVSGEEPLHDAFLTATEKYFHVAWVTWPIQEGTTFGCQITVPNGYGRWDSIADSTLRELTQIAGWNHIKSGRNVL